MVSRAFFSLNFTSSTFYISGLFYLAGCFCTTCYPPQQSPPINYILQKLYKTNIQTMQGYLQMWQGYFSRWSKYYFRIHQQLLLFGPSKQQIEGRVHLKVAQVISKLDDPVSLMINTGTQTLFIRGYSIDEKVKWYRKLKEVQKSIEQLTQNKQLFKMKMELSKVNRFKILDDLNTQLWKCHAELQQRFQEVILKTKNVMIGKNIDKLRMSIDEFKYKTSQMLQYIDQEIRDLKNKEQGKNNLQSGIQKKNVFESRYTKNDNQPQQNIYQNTLYYSFLDDNNLHVEELKPSKQMSKEKQESSVSSMSFINQNKGNFNPRRSLNKSYKYDLQDEKNPIKYRLFSTNQLYQKLQRDIFSKNQVRKSLPQRYTPEESFPVIRTLLSTLKDGDLTRVTMPVILNQPISALQRGCQQLYYSQLLNKAEEINDENMRLLYVAAFAFSTYSLNQKRTKKPFNPLLGQTFECIDQSRGIEYLSQQVSHHPPISAFYVRSNNFELFDNNKASVSFMGNSIRVVPSSKTLIKLQKFQDFYSFNKCTVSLKNILMGKTNVQIYGEIQVKCKQNNAVVKLVFQEGNLWKNNSRQVSGYLENNGKKIYQLQGDWNKELRAQHLQSNQSILLWVKSHPIYDEYYNFNDFTLQLNHLSLYNGKNLPPTDSRFRPDQRSLQYQYLDMAIEQKHRLEEKQRARRRQNQKNKNEHKILWFKHNVLQGQDVYMSNERYWGEKMKGNWKECLDIY